MDLQRAKKLATTLILSAVLAAICTGCSSNKLADQDIYDQKAKDLASATSLTPSQAIEQAAKQLSQADDDLAFYAPIHMQLSNDSLRNAQKALDKGEEPATILQYAFLVETQIKSAYKNKEQVKNTLPKALTSKKMLEEVGADKKLPLRYQKAIDSLEQLIRLIEQGQMAKAISGEEVLLKNMTQVEIDTLKKIHLTPVQDILEQAEQFDAKKFAPATYENAIKRLEKATNYINIRFRDRKGVTQEAQAASLAAKHALVVAQESAKIVGLSHKDAEKRILLEQERLQRINKALKVDHLQTLSLYDASIMLATKAAGSQPLRTKNPTPEKTTKPTKKIKLSTPLKTEKKAATKPLLAKEKPSPISKATKDGVTATTETPASKVKESTPITTATKSNKVSPAVSPTTAKNASKATPKVQESTTNSNNSVSSVSIAKNDAAPTNVGATKKNETTTNKNVEQPNSPEKGIKPSFSTYIKNKFLGMFVQESK